MAQMVNREAPYSGLANLMAMRGRMGDTELVHMSKPEIKGLASLGELTINPDTGLPEAFKLKSILPTVAGIGAAFATGGTSLLIPALATGLTSAVVNKDIGRGLFDGLLSYAGGSIMKGLTAGTPVDPTKPAIEAATGSIGQITPAQAATQASQNFGAALQQPAQGSLMYNLPTQAQTAAAGPGGFAVPSMPTVGAYTPPASPFVYAQDVPASSFQKAFGLASDKVAGEAATGLEALNAGVGDISQLTGLEKAKFIGMRAAPGIAGAALESAMTPEYPEPELLSGTVSTPRTPRTLTRTPLRSTPVTEEEALAAALGTGPGLRFSDYTTRYANQGGLVGFATGGFLAALAKGEQVPGGALGSLPPHVARGLMENPEIGRDITAFMNLVNSQPSTKDLMGGGRPYFEGMVPGTAHGMKDNVAFKVQGGNIDTAMLSPGEYVVPADVVAMLGNGNGDSGAKELDAFAKGVRQKAFGTEKQQKQINAPKELGQLATA